MPQQYVLGLPVSQALDAENFMGAACNAEAMRLIEAWPDWPGRACILAGPLSFILVGNFFGLAPATFSCVFISSLGDKSGTLKSSLVLALVITVLGVGLFSYLLQVPMPVFEWRGL